MCSVSQMGVKINPLTHKEVKGYNNFNQNLLAQMQQHFFLLCVQIAALSL